MHDFVAYAFVILNLVVRLVLPGLLTLLYLRTRSKGLLVISATLFISRLFGASFNAVIGQYITGWSRGEVNNWLTQYMTVGEFSVIFYYMKTLLYDGSLLLGVFLVYRDWSSGKIHQRHHEPLESISAESNSSLG